VISGIILCVCIGLDGQKRLISRKIGKVKYWNATSPITTLHRKVRIVLALGVAQTDDNDDQGGRGPWA
jgi:hypothetical protein